MRAFSPLSLLGYAGAADTTKRTIESSYIREVGGNYVPKDHVQLTYTDWDAWDKYVCACMLLAVFLICTEGGVWDTCGEGKGEGAWEERERERTRETQPDRETCCVSDLRRGGCFGQALACLPCAAAHAWQISPLNDGGIGEREGERERERVKEIESCGGGGVGKSVRAWGLGCMCVCPTPGLLSSSVLCSCRSATAMHTLTRVHTVCRWAWRA